MMYKGHQVKGELVVGPGLIYPLDKAHAARVAILTTVLFLFSYEVESKDTTEIPKVPLNFFRRFSKTDNDSTENSNPKTFRRSSKHSDIRKTIWSKIVELTPLLDDNKYESKQTQVKNNGEIFMKSYDETKVNPVKLKYEKMRKVIEKLLKVEPISNDTKHVVNEALDQIDNELNVTECSLNKIEGDEIRRRKVHAGEPCIVIPKNMEQREKVMKHIKKKWDKIVDQYSMPDIDADYNETARKVAFVFLTRLRQFVFDVHDDYAKLQKRYEIKCDSENHNNNTGAIFPIFRPAHPDKESAINNETEDTCDDATICSAELLDYLSDFYDQLNETYSEVFKNYLEMYLKEVDATKDEKEYFSTVFDRIQHQVRRKVKKMFTKEIGMLNDGLGDISSRIPNLRRLVDRIINNVKELIYASLSVKLRKMKPRLRLTVKQDIDVATRIELGNLQKEFKDRICSSFKDCNGDRILRKHYGIVPNSFASMSPKGSKIKLKIGGGDTIPRKKEINFVDGHENNALFKDLNQLSARKIYVPFDNEIEHVNGYKNNTRVMRDLNNFSAAKNHLPYDTNNYKNVKVTRTTYLDEIKKSATSSVQASSKRNNTNSITIRTFKDSAMSY